MENVHRHPFPGALRKHAFLLGKSGAPGGTRTPDLLVRSQTLYPTELRARSETLHCQQFTASSSSISTSSFGSFGTLVRNHWVRYLSHGKQFKLIHFMHDRLAASP